HGTGDVALGLPLDATGLAVDKFDEESLLLEQPLVGGDQFGQALKWLGRFEHKLLHRSSSGSGRSTASDHHPQVPVRSTHTGQVSGGGRVATVINQRRRAQWSAAERFCHSSRPV